MKICTLQMLNIREFIGMMEGIDTVCTLASKKKLFCQFNFRYQQIMILYSTVST